MLGEIKWGESHTGRVMFEVKARADVMIRLKRIFPRAEHRRSGWIGLSDTPEVARDLEWALARWPMQTDAAAAERITDRAQQHRDTEQTVREVLAGGRPTLRLGEPHCEHREYQALAADLCLSTGSLLLMDELGLGKTITALLTLGARDALPALIVVPTHLPPHWLDRVAMVWPLLRTHVVRKLHPYDIAERMHGYDPDVLVMGYSKLRGWGDTLAGRVKTVIFDEVQDLRRDGTAKYIAAAQITDGATYAMGLSATPIYNYGGEIFNIMSVLSPDALGCRDEFAREWCGGYWYDAKTTLTDPAALADYLRDSGLILRRTRKDVGRELPEAIELTHAIETSEERFDALTETARDLALKIVRADGTRQELFTTRGDFDLRLRQATGIAKAPYVADFARMLLETDEQVVLWGWHREVYEIWLQRLADHNPVMYTGSESPAAKQRNFDAFCSGESKLLIMSLRSGAGIDGLHEVCKVGVFGELDWSPGIHKQCVGRLRRDGMIAHENDPPLAYYLVSSIGTDPIMADVLDLKEQQAAPFENPDAPLFTQAKPGGDRIKALAESFLKVHASPWPGNDHARCPPEPPGGRQ